MFFVSTFISTLNDDQLKAVLHTNGPAMVLAGAGSGKTTVLTSRVARLIQEGHAQPHEIVVVTFTNKAAGEIRERILDKTGYRLPFSGTFHSICARILRTDGNNIGLDSNFSIYDSSDQKELFKQIFTDLSIDKTSTDIGAVAATISKAKNELIDVKQYESMSRGSFQQIVARIYKVYQHKLRAAQAVDFDDLLFLTHRLLKTTTAIREKYQKQISHILIDEYQDTNKVQYELSKLFSAPQNNIYVVGDFSQSIYGWRGADYRNMLQLTTDFSNVVEYRLEQNYRSNQNILDAATQVISLNTTHPILSLWTTQSAGEKIHILECEDGRREASEICSRIQELRPHVPLNEMAILYRTNAQSREFEESFIKKGIPYQLIGGTKFYERKEIKDVISYLRYAINQSDSVSYERIIKLGKRRFDNFQIWTSQNSSLSLTAHPAAIIKQILDVTDYLKKYERKTEENLQRIANIEELVNVAAQFESVTNFLENIALIQNDYLMDGESSHADRGAVSLMSFHAAKGLEFAIVFMAGMEEGIFPHSRSFIEPDQMEEERRLCYVGITRAKQRLFLSYARSRFHYGRSSQSLPSRFINDIDHDLLKIEVHANNRYQAWNQVSSKQLSNSSERRYVSIDDDMMEGVLAGDISIEELINR